MATTCAICLAEAADDECRVVPCGHAFCRACIVRWLDVADRAAVGTCPHCRGVVVGLSPPPRASAAAVRPLRRVLHIRCAQGEHVGVTVSDAAACGGVRVVRTERADAAHRAGLRPRDVILAVNGVPCRTHAAVARQVDEATRLRLSMCLDVRCHRAPVSWFARARADASRRFFAWRVG